MKFLLVIFSILPSIAVAQEGGASGMAAMDFLPLLLIFVVFYFLIIRPQSKRAKDHRTMLEELARGDKIVTSGGIYGSVKRVAKDSDRVEVEISDGVTVEVAKFMISQKVD